MIFYDIEKLLEGVKNRYWLVMIASKRALSLNQSGYFTDSAEKVTSVALREIQEGKVTYKIKEEDEDK